MVDKKEINFAEEIIVKIYKDLINKDVGEKIGILDGTGGLVLFGFYYSRYFNDEKAYNWSYQKIEYILHNLKKDVKSTTLTSGLAGIAWLLKHLEINGFIDLGKDFSFKEIDDFLIRLMTHELKISNYDLLHGSLGTVLYFLSQGSSFTRPEVLSNFAITLYEKSIWDEKVCKWVNSGINYGSNGGQIGLAHGISSIIAILSKLYSRGIETDLVQEMIYGATKYLLKQKNNNPSFISLFPMLSTDEEDPTPSRLAWCYGDLGIGISLWRAGKELSDQRLKEQAIETFFHSTKRTDLKKNNVLDSHFCHGTSGIGSVFRRMYLETNINEFNVAADYWFRKTLKFSVHKDGIGGYKFLELGLQNEWINNSNLLQGAAGVGLFMLSYINNIDPKWDELFLLS